MSPDTLGLQIRRQKGKTVDAQIAEYWSYDYFRPL